MEPGNAGERSFAFQYLLRLLVIFFNVKWDPVRSSPYKKMARLRPKKKSPWGGLFETLFFSVQMGKTSDDGAAAPALEGGGGGSSDPPAGSEDGFRCRPHGVRAGSARIDRVGLAQARRHSAMSDARRRL